MKKSNSNANKTKRGNNIRYKTRRRNKTLNKTRRKNRRRNNTRNKRIINQDGGAPFKRRRALLEVLRVINNIFGRFNIKAIEKPEVDNYIPGYLQYVPGIGYVYDKEKSVRRGIKRLGRTLKKLGRPFKKDETLVDEIYKDGKTLLDSLEEKGINSINSTNIEKFNTLKESLDKAISAYGKEAPYELTYIRDEIEGKIYSKEEKSDKKTSGFVRQAAKIAGVDHKKRHKRH